MSAGEATTRTTYREGGRMLFEKGDRIEVTGPMVNEPDPIPVGSRGTVLYTGNVGTPYEQVYVDWDESPDGWKRSLILIPEDYGIVRKVTWTEREVGEVERRAKERADRLRGKID
jgi:hypothetical protein